MSNFKNFFAAAALLLLATPAFADLASDKAAVEAAKAAGTVGEQADGYLGFVNGSADGAVKSVQLVKVKDIRQALPADARFIDAATRASILKQRAADYARRYEPTE